MVMVISPLAPRILKSKSFLSSFGLHEMSGSILVFLHFFLISVLFQLHQSLSERKFSNLFPCMELSIFPQKLLKLRCFHQWPLSQLWEALSSWTSLSLHSSLVEVYFPYFQGDDLSWFSNCRATALNLLFFLPVILNHPHISGLCWYPTVFASNLWSFLSDLAFCRYPC